MKKVTVIFMVLVLALIVPLSSAQGADHTLYLKDGVAVAYPQYAKLDLAQLQPSRAILWWYDWGACPIGIYPKGCVPMSVYGEDNFLQSYTGPVLIFNEPETAGGGSNYITPADAVTAYINLRSIHPLNQYVLGNNYIWSGIDWLLSFWSLCQNNPNCILPEYIGLHFYVDQDWQIQTLHDIIDYNLPYWFGPNQKYWITEFADITGNVSRLDALYRLFPAHPKIERWAYFTNRAQETEIWWPVGWDNLQLFDWGSGTITLQGDTFRKLIRCFSAPYNCDFTIPW